MAIVLMSLLAVTASSALAAWAPIARAASAPAPGGAYTALTPTRLLDTRVAGGPQSLTSAGTLTLPVTGVFGSVTVPSTATAVALNVTATDTSADGFLTVYPAGGATPVISNLNWMAGETVSNLVIVEVGSGGAVTFYNAAGNTALVVDLEGYFAPQSSGTTAGSYVPLTPARISDTRPGSAEPNSGQTLQGATSLAVQVGGAGGVPSTGVAAAVLNVTVTNTTSAGFLTAYPGPNLPTASNLNWAAGETIAHRVIVPLDQSTGQITVYNSGGSTDVVVDVTGFFTTGSTTPAAASLFTPLSPTRILDSRLSRGPLANASGLVQGLADVGGIAANVSAVVLNVTVTDTSDPSFLTLYPSTPTGSSDVNWSPGQTIPNLTIATLNQNGTTNVYNDQGSTDLVIDAFGYFVPLNPAPEILTSLLTPANIGIPYAASLAGEGGAAPYGFALTSGQLPPGLALSSSGEFTGTPSAIGSFSFTVKMTDASTPNPIVVTNVLPFSVSLAPAAVMPGVAGAAPILSTALTAAGTPILDSPPTSRLYLTVSPTGVSSWSTVEPPTGYPGQTTITDALAFPNSPDSATILAVISECNAYWGLPNSAMGVCENLPDYRGECSFWAVMNWSGGDPLAITQNGAGIAAKAIAESALTGATSSSVPAVGELVSWQPAGTLYDAPYGHAAVVVGVNPSTFTYVVEEMDFGLNPIGDWDIDVRVVSDNAAQPPSFAAPPAA